MRPLIILSVAFACLLGLPLPHAWAVGVEDPEAKTESINEALQKCSLSIVSKGDENKVDPGAVNNSPACVKWWRMFGNDKQKMNANGYNVSIDPKTGTIIYTPKLPNVDLPGGAILYEDRIDTEEWDKTKEDFIPIMSQ